VVNKRKRKAVRRYISALDLRKRREDFEGAGYQGQLGEEMQ
jgi:hypothetical protein